MKIRYDLVSCFPVRSSDQGRFEFLQLRRQRDDFMGGTWQPVSGSIEKDEKPADAALRELKEEAGLSPIEFYQLNRVAIFYIAEQDTLWHCIQYCAIVRAADQVQLNEEHDAFRWVSAEKVQSQFMWPGDRGAIDEINREILQSGLAKPYMKVPIPL